MAEARIRELEADAEGHDAEVASLKRRLERQIQANGELEALLRDWREEYWEIGHGNCARDICLICRTAVALGGGDDV